MNWNDFLAMGGYGLYVWGSYAAAAAVLIANVWLPLRAARRVRRRLHELHRIEEHRR
jgi:heme exporter protein D